MTGKEPNVTVNASEVFALGAIVQVEREFVRDNKSLESFRLNGTPHAPCGVPPIVVKFDGILSLTREQKRSRNITITGASTLPIDEELKRLGDKGSWPSKEKVEPKVKDLKDAISGGSTQAMKEMQWPPRIKKL
ncbi:stromal 70 kda heat shock-related protein [Quercus suber]|uniref:Stromal 70 kDa heat shock-related protein n=1 Tax=Quercus suber TaxID=58331 RepID=A0AAW0IHK8_QUESU